MSNKLSRFGGWLLLVLILSGPTTGGEARAESAANVESLLRALEAAHELRFRTCGEPADGVSLCATTDDGAASVRETVSRWVPELAGDESWGNEKKRARARFALGRQMVWLTFLKKKQRLFVEFGPALPDCGDDPRIARLDEHLSDPTYAPPARLAGIGDHPAYPERARVERAGGRLEALATLDTEGRVTDLCALEVVKRGVGFEGAFVSAVREWRYRPATLHGRKIAVPFRLQGAWDLR